MKQKKNDIKELVNVLNEREKELKCIYKIEDFLKDFNSDFDSVMENIIGDIACGWQYPELCMARIKFKNKEFTTKNFRETRWFQEAIIKSDDKPVGRIQIYYSKLPDDYSADYTTNPFLPEEQKLLNSIAERIGNYLFYREIKIQSKNAIKAEKISQNEDYNWKVVINLIENTDLNLYLRISRKMINYLCWIGIDEAKKLLYSFGIKKVEKNIDSVFETNKPVEKQNIDDILKISKKAYSIAEKYVSNQEIIKNIHKWIQEDKLSFLVTVLENLDTSLTEIQDAIMRYNQLNLNKSELSPYSKLNISVLLIQRLFTDQLEFVNIAKNYVCIKDFYDVIQHTVFPNNSHGKLGGKSSGLFIADSIIKSSEDNELKEYVNIPKTWYITSDAMQSFLHFNNLEEIVEQKYKNIEQIREEYSNIIQIFKNSHFPHDIIKGLSLALDDFGDNPIIVRSSSLLEDRFGAAFSGKYKSLFLANQGSKAERLNALMDAISEIYASTVAPDPLEYRKVKGLIDFHEEMAIMIQEVIGKKVGKYFFPAFAGVAFNNNEFRWSPRIKREDGLVRMVPGLGTRAVDRLINEYPILASPGKPNIRVNVSPEEILKYSPKKIDLINLDNNTFESVAINEILKDYGEEFPLADKILSVYEDNQVVDKSSFNLDFENDELVVTFNKLFSQKDFLQKLKRVIKLLKDKMKTPVDIEFAVSDQGFSLLQCRPQCFSYENLPSPIPKDIPEENIIFTADKFISNGKIPQLTHIVYVDPEQYCALENREDLKNVARVVGRLNSLLPKKKFILMGPGRWGSKGDIKLGVPITYADINNTAALIEIAREKGNYVPDLSFGTHFFQDLVESSIRYLPLYPDDDNIIFNESFLKRSDNMLEDLLPKYSYLKKCVHVIDIAAETEGKILNVLMNAELDEAVAYIGTPTKNKFDEESQKNILEKPTEDHWKWRLKMAQRIAEKLDFDRFEIAGVYIFGSVKNANSGPASDIDLLIHFNGNDNQRNAMMEWLKGWSLCLAEVNFLKTGYKTEGLLDTHIVTDEDIKNKTSFAAKMNAVTDAARPLRTKSE